MKRPFLTARWKYLVMMNYEIDPGVLQPLVPRGTELDYFRGKTYVSLVGFRFEQTRVLGIPIPFHQNFEEINLRFYVRRTCENETRRGVVFIREIVPRAAIAVVARVIYHENYTALRTRSQMQFSEQSRPSSVQYAWRFKRRWNSMSIESFGSLSSIAPGSEEEFITEHYWGYTKRRDGRTSEYQVEHPQWRIWQTRAAALECDITRLYGAAFAGYIHNKPSSVFLAEGSDVAVSAGRIIS